MRYLADAQFLGLVGLWQKLCAKQLPERCTKAWFFETFCGVSSVEFEQRNLAQLDASADILSHLNGFVKPCARPVFHVMLGAARDATQRVCGPDLMYIPFLLCATLSSALPLSTLTTPPYMQL